MNNTKILSVITLLIALILIGTGYSMIFIDNYQVDAKEKESYASLIKNSFISYNSDLEEISYLIKNMDIFENKYYEDIKNNYEKNINLLTEIDNKLKQIETTSEMFLYECRIRDYNDNDIEYKCHLVEHNYESVINAYVSLIQKYNNKFMNYNVWINNDIDSLKIYKSKYYKDYIDINYDGEYIGIIK